MERKVRYAKVGSFDIAYQVVGDGPIDLVLSPGWPALLDLGWEIPTWVGRSRPRVENGPRPCVGGRHPVRRTRDARAQRHPGKVRAVRCGSGGILPRLRCYGAMFWFTRNRLSGSNILFTPTSRRNSLVAVPDPALIVARSGRGIHGHRAHAERRSSIVDAIPLLHPIDPAAFAVDPLGTRIQTGYRSMPRERWTSAVGPRKPDRLACVPGQR
jgi:hypothetical protein